MRERRGRREAERRIEGMKGREGEGKRERREGGKRGGGIHGWMDGWIDGERKERMR